MSTTMVFSLLFAGFIALTLCGVLFISLFYMVAVRQLVLAGRLRRVLPLPFINPWRVLAAYRALLREQERPLALWLLMQLTLAMTLLGVALLAALLFLPRLPR